jgi:hypothetical protein
MIEIEKGASYRSSHLAILRRDLECQAGKFGHAPWQSRCHLGVNPATCGASRDTKNWGLAEIGDTDSSGPNLAMLP